MTEKTFLIEDGLQHHQLHHLSHYGQHREQHHLS